MKEANHLYDVTKTIPVQPTSVGYDHLIVVSSFQLKQYKRRIKIREYFCYGRTSHIM